jgi:hypothetical protein
VPRQCPFVLLVEVTLPILAPVVLLITPRHGPP